MLAVFISLLALGTVAVIPGYQRHHAHFASDLQGETIRIVNAAIDPRTYPTVTRLVAIGEHLVNTSNIAGGIYVTGIGVERASFGDPPELTWSQARLAGENWRLGDGNATFDVFLGPEITGVSYGLLVRVDSREAWAQTLWRLIEIIVLGIVAAIGLAIATGVFASRLICQPLARIDRAVKEALDDPAGAARYLSRVGSHDEIGRLSHALDQLLFAISVTFDEELPVSQAITEQTQHAILTFSEWGHPMTANAAALRMFGAKDLDELMARDARCVFRFEGNPTVAPKLLMNGPAFGPGEIVRANETIPCLVAGDAVRRPDGTPARYFVMFVDMSRVVADVREQVALRQVAEREKLRTEDELAKLRGRFEACMVLLEADGSDEPRARPVTIDPNGLIEGWLGKAITRGAMRAGGVIHDDLPLLRGDPGEMRRLFDAALETVRLRSGDEKPTIVVNANADADEFSLFTIRSVDTRGDRPFGAISQAEDVSLFLAAVAALARREGGQLVASKIGDDGNAVGLKLPLDRDNYTSFDEEEAVEPAA
jgi:hypothetical protein